MSVASATKAGNEPLDPQTIRIALVVVLGTIMAILDTTIVAVALRTLGTDFGVGVSSIQWVTTGYLLALAMVIPISGWAVHRLGPKTVWISAVTLFILGSMACGFAWSATSLICFRLLQGAGGGMIMPVGQSLMATAAGPKQMGRVMGIFGVPTLLGPILGPVIGGLIIANVSWRWIFFVNLPIGIIAVILAARLLPRDHRDREHRFDAWGFAFLSPALALLVYAMSEVGREGGFHSPRTIWLTVIGLMLGLAFVWRSLRAPEPIVDLRLFKSRTFTVSTISIFVTGITLYGVIFLLPLYYQIVRGQSAVVAGLMMAPQGIGAAIVMKRAGVIADERGPISIVPLGMLLLAVGTFAYTMVSPTTNLWWLGISLFVRGIGLGLGMMPVFAASYRGLLPAQVPRASTTTNIVRQVGGSIGTALYAVVLERAIQSRFHGTTGSLSAIPSKISPDVANQLAASFSIAFWWAFATCVVAIVPTLFLPGPSKGLEDLAINNEGEVAEHG